MNFVNNRWYVAAWDGEVGATPLGRTICGEAIVLYRKLDGSVVALRDACPHRLLPLSLGSREGDAIRCRYHGMLIGPEGAPEQMPLINDRVNKTMCTPRYAVAEKYRFVWVWIGDQARADPALIPDFWPCGEDGWAFDGGYTNVACDYRLLVDNLMDLTHETYVHQGSIGQNELMEAPLETHNDGDSVTVSRWMPGVNPPPFWRDALRADGAVDRWQICNFVAPCSVLIDVGVALVAAGATLQDHAMGTRGFVIDSMTPETETTCHYFWGMARNFDVDDAGVTERIKAGQRHIFSEDVDVLERQQKSILANPDLRLRVLNIDAGGAHARRTIQKMIDAQSTGD